MSNKKFIPPAFSSPDFIKQMRWSSHRQCYVRRRPEPRDRIRLVVPDNAPGCFLIRGCGSADNRRGSLLVQQDWDFPSVASTFGWWLGKVKSPTNPKCEHNGTDGTIKCPSCGLEPGDFIQAAAAWLRKNEGKMADNPGYDLELDGR